MLKSDSDQSFRKGKKSGNQIAGQVGGPIGVDQHGYTFVELKNRPSW